MDWWEDQPSASSPARGPGLRDGKMQQSSVGFGVTTDVGPFSQKGMSDDEAMLPISGRKGDNL